MNMLQIVIFVLASAGLVYVSRTSLRRPHAHGFYRFWAWEAIVALVLLNVPIWFRAVSYTHLRAHETVLDLVCRLLLEKKKR